MRKASTTSGAADPRTALHTFSVTARCERTGELGIAVSTAAMCVGALVPYIQTGVGAVASQAFVNPYLGFLGLELLGKGMSSEETIAELVRRDPGIKDRQVAVVDANGDASAYSGDECVDWFGHSAGPGVAFAGNMLTGPETIDNMASSWQKTVDDDLAHRLLQALQAGHHAGGDKRGHRSAALRVLGDEDYAQVDLRIDDDPDPVARLLKLYEVASADLLPIITRLAKRSDLVPAASPETPK
jgi:uncharacterized Ntn-hydrolase superfamily protein